MALCHRHEGRFCCCRNTVRVIPQCFLSESLTCDFASIGYSDDDTAAPCIGKGHKRFNRLCILLAYGLVELASPLCAFAALRELSPRPCTITRIIDGDTLIATINGTSTRLRLAGIDSPELAQPHGRASRDYLVNIVSSAPITLHSHGPDRYGRTLATLFVGDNNINLAMVRTGNAWRYRYARKAGPTAEAEALARAEGRGLWARDTAVAPWEFRSAR